MSTCINNDLNGVLCGHDEEFHVTDGSCDECLCDSFVPNLEEGEDYDEDNEDQSITNSL